MGRLARIKGFFWDEEHKTFLGRTRDSWAKIIAFYITFYTCLAAIWTVYFYIFHLTIDGRYPKWQLDESLIGANPGVGLRPQSPRHRVDSALISFKDGPEGDYQHWVEDLRDFLEVSNTSGGNSTERKTSCSPQRDPADLESFCPFDSSSIPAECTPAQNFSFPLGKPCLLIKLNRIYGWRPEPLESPPSDYPPGAPFTAGNIQITCEGQHDADKEHIGPVDYFPRTGIETKYYPFVNQPGYQSPYVMVHFKEPKLDTLIYVECKAWARNIEHDRYNRKGLTVFELFIEKSAAAAPS